MPARCGAVCNKIHGAATFQHSSYQAFQYFLKIGLTLNKLALIHSGSQYRKNFTSSWREISHSWNLQCTRIIPWIRKRVGTFQTRFPGCDDHNKAQENHSTPVYTCTMTYVLWASLSKCRVLAVTLWYIVIWKLEYGQYQKGQYRPFIIEEGVIGLVTFEHRCPSVHQTSI